MCWSIRGNKFLTKSKFCLLDFQNLKLWACLSIFVFWRAPAWPTVIFYFERARARWQFASSKVRARTLPRNSPIRILLTNFDPVGNPLQNFYRSKTNNSQPWRFLMKSKPLSTLSSCRMSPLTSILHFLPILSLKLVPLVSSQNFEAPKFSHEKLYLFKSFLFGKFWPGQSFHFLLYLIPFSKILI